MEVVREPAYPIAVGIVLAAGRSWIWLPLAVDQALGSVATLLLAIGVAWLWWRFADSIGRRLVGRVFGESGRAREEAVDVGRKVLRLFGVTMFALVMARMLFDADLGTLLAGVGIVGIACSIAAQDTLRNLLASVTLHGDRPFAPSDLVRFQGHLGHVEEIGFRSTRLRALAGPVVTIPNSELVRENIENLSARDHIRHHYPIDLVYRTPADRVQEAIGIVDGILQERDFPDEHEPHVSFDEFAPSSLRIALWYTSPTGDYFEARRERTEVNLEIVRRFDEAGLEFAFPTRTLHVASDDADDPDVDEAGGDADEDPGEPES
jgi:MscS family membrane protein